MHKFLTIILIIFIGTGFILAQAVEQESEEILSKEKMTKEFVKRTHRYTSGFLGLDKAGLTLEDFENGVWPPAGWAEFHSGIDALDVTNEQAYSPTNSATFNDVSGVDTSWFVSPQILSLDSTSRLTFYQYQTWGSYYDYHAIWVSTGYTDPDSGDYVEVANLGVGTGPWEIKYIDLNAFTGQDVYVAFVYYGSYADQWYIDDVVIAPAPITGIFNTPISEFHNNSFVPVGDAVSEYVDITNFGGGDLTISIVNTSSGDITTDFTSNIVIPSFGTVSVLVTWTPSTVAKDTGWVEFVHDGPTAQDSVYFTVHSIAAGSFVIDFEADPIIWRDSLVYGLSSPGTIGSTEINHHWGIRGNWWRQNWAPTSPLWSPRLDLTSGPSEMGFYYKGRTSGNDTVDVMIATAVDTTILGSVTNTGTHWRFQIFDLSAWAGENKIKIGWKYRYATGSTSGDNWYMDDLVLPQRYYHPTVVFSDDVATLPTQFALKQNYPNPFNPTTTIKYQLAKKSDVKIVIYNILGQAVRTLVDNSVDAGYHQKVWDGMNDFGNREATGIYFYRMVAKDFVKSKKMVLMK